MCQNSCGHNVLGRHRPSARSKAVKILRALGISLGTLMKSALIAQADPLSLEQFEALSVKCAPSISLQAALAVAKTESRLYPFALHNNTRSETLFTSSIAYAKSQLKVWLDAGDSVDVGLMQINSGNLASLGLNADSALDPCRSLEGSGPHFESRLCGREQRSGAESRHPNRSFPVQHRSAASGHCQWLCGPGDRIRKCNFGR